MTTLEEIGEQAGVYPTEHLAGCDDALLLFAAGFHGRNDGYHIAKAGLRAVCVDHASMDVMRSLYPDDWEFLRYDVFWFLHHGRAQLDYGKFDVVSVDPPSGLVGVCLDDLVWIERAARRLMVVGVTGYALAEYEYRSPAEFVLGPGWEHLEPVKRSDNFGGCWWMVARRET